MRIGERIVRLDSCSSTNDVAKDLAAQGELEGTVVIADEQTEGRGRLGRKWHSQKTLGLYASLLLRPPENDISLLTLMGGVALCEAVRISAGAPVYLKWPNDLVWKGKKAGGILSESSMVGERLEYVILGFGLNVGHRSEDFPESLRTSAISVSQIVGRTPDPLRIQSQLWKQLEHGYDLFLKGQKMKIMSCFMERSYFTRGEKLTIETAEGNISGHFAGIGFQGGLILETAGGKKTFFAAEIRSLQPSMEI